MTVKSVRAALARRPTSSTSMMEVTPNNGSTHDRLKVSRRVFLIIGGSLCLLDRVPPLTLSAHYAGAVHGEPRVPRPGKRAARSGTKSAGMRMSFDLPPAWGAAGTPRFSVGASIPDLRVHQLPRDRVRRYRLSPGLTPLCPDGSAISPDRSNWEKDYPDGTRRFGDGRRRWTTRHITGAYSDLGGGAPPKWILRTAPRAPRACGRGRRTTAVHCRRGIGRRRGKRCHWGCRSRRVPGNARAAAS